MTGQLVLSTLHAEDSIGALFRILDLGIETYLLNSSLTGIISQRLIRKVCSDCREEYVPSQDEADIFQKVLGHVPERLTRGRGCPTCQNLAYKGRTGIFEVLKMDARIRGLIRSKANEDILRDTLVREGFITLLRDGLEKAREGVTTVEEVLRNSLKIV